MRKNWTKIKTYSIYKNFAIIIKKVLDNLKICKYWIIL